MSKMVNEAIVRNVATFIRRGFCPYFHQDGFTLSHDISFFHGGLQVFIIEPRLTTQIGKLTR